MEAFCVAAQLMRHGDDAPSRVKGRLCLWQGTVKVVRRSEINGLVRDASAILGEVGWALPPEPRWDVTDFGLGDVRRYGLVLVNLADEPEYCEKIMVSWRGMETPAHRHRVKKEDIVCRAGVLRIRLDGEGAHLDGRPVGAGEHDLQPGSRVTLTPGVVHAFWPVSEWCVIGEVSTANDDANDNLFDDPRVGRFPAIDEDEAPQVRLVSDR